MEHQVAGIWRPHAVSGHTQHSCQIALSVILNWSPSGARAAGHSGKSARLALVTLAVFLQTMLCVFAALAKNFGEWGSPVSLNPDRTIGINTPFNDGCPIESPDRCTLYFATDRIENSLDIWTASRGIDNEWKIEPLTFPVNTPAAEFCPTPLPGNRLLFVSTRGQQLRRSRPQRGYL